ncbi:hypothetical protein Tco_1276502 [Tanacetum coccineum]
MNTSQDIKVKMVDDNVGNQVRQNAVQNDGNKVGQNVVQMPSIQIVENMNGLSVVSEIDYSYGNGNGCFNIGLRVMFALGMKRESKSATALQWDSFAASNPHLNAKNSKELGSKVSLASSRPSKPRTCLRWIPTGRIFAMCGKLTASSNTENKSEKYVCDNARTSNPSEPSSKGFPISTSLLGRLSRLRKQHTSIYPTAVL